MLEGSWNYVPIDSCSALHIASSGSGRDVKGIHLVCFEELTPHLLGGIW
jgi:hypothetical protein